MTLRKLTNRNCNTHQPNWFIDTPSVLVAARLLLFFFLTNYCKFTLIRRIMGVGRQEFWGFNPLPKQPILKTLNTTYGIVLSFQSRSKCYNYNNYQVIINSLYLQKRCQHMGDLGLTFIPSRFGYPLPQRNEILHTPITTSIFCTRSTRKYNFLLQSSSCTHYYLTIVLMYLFSRKLKEVRVMRNSIEAKRNQFIINVYNNQRYC